MQTKEAEEEDDLFPNPVPNFDASKYRTADKRTRSTFELESEAVIYDASRHPDDEKAFCGDWPRWLSYRLVRQMCCTHSEMMAALIITAYIA